MLKGWLGPAIFSQPKVSVIKFDDPPPRIGDNRVNSLRSLVVKRDEAAARFLFLASLFTEVKSRPDRVVEYSDWNVVREKLKRGSL